MVDIGGLLLAGQHRDEVMSVRHILNIVVGIVVRCLVAG